MSEHQSETKPQCRQTFAFDAIGTHWEIDTPEPLAAPLRARILERIERFDATYSRFRDDSLVARIATAEEGGCFDLPDDACGLFDLYDRLHAVTGGAVDPLAGHDLELLGYDARYSFQHDPLAIARYSHERRNWPDDVTRDGSRITTRRRALIDVGAAGKGYLVDIVAEILRADGIDAFVVDAGGDLVHRGPEPLAVGLEHPVDPALAIGIARLDGGALCASAVNRRAWGPFHHVVDGRTGVPVRDVIATWVVADDALTADGLATALFFVPAERLAGSFHFSFVRMFANGRAEISPDFDGELFT
ncbi:FAD:protein FMN transferase [Brucella lupini]|jgi:thiamine biosynthesis lipoprotein|uniref:FAD:protein FMN transferase n=1 Tax=Brucella lupini TaxID=255457 RepID=A0A256GZT6_9HYPH|nr:FAD:protein FMN transferase [Brucella lupini]KAB2703282.1 FAD:protein FMN transferase [Brucella lupini]OYR32400.1 apbE family protein [Brucella lupini]